MSNSADIINQIIENRKKNQDVICKRERSLSVIQGALSELRAKQESISTHFQDNEEALTALHGLSDKINQTVRKARDIQQELSRLKARTGRNTINIGIVGVPKQGKSTFLQALTGLDEATIPTGTDWVTGACSYICHDPKVVEGDAYALLTPYTRQEFFKDVLKPFCDKFYLYLESVDGLPDLELPSDENMGASDKSTLERLKQLKNGFSSYKELLGQDELKISKNDIRRYVAQCDESGTIKYTNWYAIKKAELHCCFPSADVGRIMICDTPGLGDFTPGAKRALMEKLGTDMDIIFFMKRLHVDNQTVLEVDAGFYDVVRDSNRVFNVKDWAYMMLNCSQGEQPSPEFLNKLCNKMTTRQDVQVLDSKNPKSVQEVFANVLKDIAEQLPKLDAELMKNYEELMKELSNSLHQIEACAKSALPSYSPVGGNIQIEEAVQSILEDLLLGINSYKDVLEQGGGNKMTQGIKDVLRHMRENSPVLEYNKLDEAAPIKWMSQGRDKLRAAFISAFSGLDVSLEEMVESTQYRLREILMKDGRLAFVLGGQEDACFWTELKTILSDELGSYAEALIKAIENVENFKMQFRAFILPRLTEITEGLSNSPKHAKKSFAPFVDGDTIENCKSKLQTAWVRAIARCENLFDDEEGDLQDINKTPTQALVALVDEFYLLWTKHGGENKATGIWRNFYKAHATEVWPQDEKVSSKMAVSRRWNQAITSFKNEISSIN